MRTVNAQPFRAGYYLIGLFCLAIGGNVAMADDKAKKHKVYQCEKDGQLVYSQVECGPDARQVTVELQQGLPDEKYVAPYVKQQSEVEKYLAEQNKQSKIAHHRANVERYKQQLAQQFEALKTIRFRSAADKDKAIKVLSDKYNALINKEHEAIKALHKQD